MIRFFCIGLLITGLVSCGGGRSDPVSKPATPTRLQNPTLSLSAPVKTNTTNWQFILSNHDKGDAHGVAQHITTKSSNPLFKITKDCSDSLEEDASCPIQVNYTGGNALAASTTVTVSYGAVDKKQLTQKINFSTEITESSDPHLTVKKAVTKTDKDVPAQYTITVSNADYSDFAGPAENITIAPVDAPFVVDPASTCEGATLLQGQSCEVVVDIAGSASKASEQVVKLKYSTGQGSQKEREAWISIAAGSGTPVVNPHLILSTAKKIFEQDGKSVYQFTLRNSDATENKGKAENIEVKSQLTTPLKYVSDATQPSCLQTTTLDTGESCVVDLEFNPEGKTVSGVQDLQITYGPTADDHQLWQPIAYQHIQPKVDPQLTLSTAEQIGSNHWRFTLKNDDNTAHAGTAENIAFTQLPDTFRTETTCANTLAQGASCTYDIYYQPTTLKAMLADTPDAGRTTLTLHDQDFGVSYGPMPNDWQLQQTFKYTVATPKVDPILTTTTELNASKSLFTLTLSNHDTSDHKGEASGIVISHVLAPLSMQSNTCASTLAEGASCQIKIAIGASAGKFTAQQVQNLTITYGDQGQHQIVQPLNFEAYGDPALTLSAATKTGDNTWQFTLTNPSADQLTQNIAVSPLDATYFNVVSNCATTLQPTASCMITVEQVMPMPPTSGANTQAVTVFYGPDPSHLHDKTQSFVYNQQDPALNITVNKATQLWTFTLTNDDHGMHRGPAENIRASGISAPLALRNNCGTSLVTDASCTMEVTIPANRGHLLTEALEQNLHISYGAINTHNYDQTISFETYGDPGLDVSSVRLSGSNTWSFALRNDTSETAQNISVSGLPDYFTATSTCPDLLAPLTSCVYTIQLTGEVPASVPANATQNFMVNYGPDVNALHQEPLSFIYNIRLPAVDPVLTIGNPESISVGPALLGGRLQWRVKVSNLDTGEHRGEARNLHFSVAPDSGLSLVADSQAPCGDTLAQNAVCYQDVMYTPSSSTDNTAKLLTVAYGEEADEHTQSVAIDTNVPNDPTVQPTDPSRSHDTTIGQPQVYTYTLTNATPATIKDIQFALTDQSVTTKVKSSALKNLTADNESPFSLDFSVTNACQASGQQLLPAQSCVIGVKFDPKTYIDAKADIVVTDQASSRVVILVEAEVDAGTVSNISVPPIVTGVSSKDSRTATITITPSQNTYPIVLPSSNAITSIDTNWGQTLTYEGDHFPGTGGTCSADTPIKMPCTLVLYYSGTDETANPVLTALTLHFSSKSQSFTKDFNVSTHVISDHVSISPPANMPLLSDLGSSSAKQIITIANAGQKDISNVHISSDAQFPVTALPAGTANACTMPVSLKADQSCQLQVAYVPNAQATAKPVNGIISVDASPAVSTTVTGDINPGTLTLSANPADLNTNEGFTAQTTVTIAPTLTDGKLATYPVTLLNPTSPLTGLPTVLTQKDSTCPAGVLSKPCQVTLVYAPPKGSGGTVVNNNHLSVGFTSRDSTQRNAAIDISTHAATASAPSLTKIASLSPDNKTATLTLTNPMSYGTLTGLKFNLSATSDMKLNEDASTCAQLIGGLAPGKTCTYVLNYVDNTTKASSATAYVTTNEGLQSNVATINWQNPSQIQVSMPSPVMVLAHNTKRVVKVTINALPGHYLPKITGVSFPSGGEVSYAGGGFPGVGGTCNADIQLEGSCVVTLAVAENTPYYGKIGAYDLGIEYADGSAAGSATKNITAQVETQPGLFLLYNDKVEEYNADQPTDTQITYDVSGLSNAHSLVVSPQGLFMVASGADGARAYQRIWGSVAATWQALGDENLALWDSKQLANESLAVLGNNLYAINAEGNIVYHDVTKTAADDWQTVSGAPDARALTTNGVNVFASTDKNGPLNGCMLTQVNLPPLDPVSSQAFGCGMTALFATDDYIYLASLDGVRYQLIKSLSSSTYPTGFQSGFQTALTVSPAIIGTHYIYIARQQVDPRNNHGLGYNNVYQLTTMDGPSGQNPLDDATTIGPKNNTLTGFSIDKLVQVNNYIYALVHNQAGEKQVYYHSLDPSTFTQAWVALLPEMSTSLQDIVIY